MATQLEALSAEILQEAQKEASKIVQEGEAEARRIISEAETQLKAKAEAVVSQAKNDANAVERKFLSEAKHKTRLARLTSLNALVDEVLNRARKKVTDVLSEKDRREKMILGMIKEALAEIENGNVKIGINKATSEAVNFSRLKSETSKLGKTKIDWFVSIEVDADGVVVDSADGKTRVVNTVSSLFERLENQILTEIKRQLFSETKQR